MQPSLFHKPKCPVHGEATKRQSCQQCNAAYMRVYMKQRRLKKPTTTLLERARSRAIRRGVRFSIALEHIVIPQSCPALGIPILLGEERSANSPSLDRIVPKLGYVPGNVRVISDRANRLNSNRSLSELRKQATSGPPSLRADYSKIATYVDREMLLNRARRRAAESRRASSEWEKIASFLERLVQPT